MDAALLLQRGADDQAAAAGNDGRAAKLGALLENDGARSLVERLDAGGDAGAARADDCNVGLVLPDPCHGMKSPIAGRDHRGQVRL